MSRNMRYKKSPKKPNLLPIVSIFAIGIIATAFVFLSKGGDTVSSSGDISISPSPNIQGDNLEDDDEEEHLGGAVADIPDDQIGTLEESDDPQVEPLVIDSYPFSTEVTQNIDVYVIPSTNSRVVEKTREGDIVSISSLTTNTMEGVNTPDMLKITTANGTIGFIEPSFIDSEILDKLCELDGFVSKTATKVEDAFNIFDEKYVNLSIDEKFGLLKEWFPINRNWNTIGLDISGLDQDYAASLITDSACNGSTTYCHCYNGATLHEFNYSRNIQCLAFASMVSDFLFGKDAPITTFTDVDEIRVGDHIRLTSATHSFVITEVTDDGFRVVEVNRDYTSCRIKWDRYITKSELSGYAYKVLSRY